MYGREKNVILIMSRETPVSHSRHTLHGGTIDGRTMELYQYQLLHPYPSPANINIGVRKQISGSTGHTSQDVSLEPRPAVAVSKLKSPAPRGRDHSNPYRTPYDYPRPQSHRNKIGFPPEGDGDNHAKSSAFVTSEEDDIDAIVRDILDTVSWACRETIGPNQEAASKTNAEAVLEDCKSVSLEDNFGGGNTVELGGKNNKEQNHFFLSSTDFDDTINHKEYRKIFSHKVWNASAGKWFPTKHYWIRNKVEYKKDDHKSKHFRITLSRGGQLHIFPSLLDSHKVHEVKEELLQSKLWRKYSIQGGDEPRLHFLLHENATDEFDHNRQPGYRYASITMKARPLAACPKIHQLSNDLARFRNIEGEKWNIGVHPVLYRDNKDSMGEHADDDQGETRILCVLLESPPKPRKVVIKVFDKLTGGRRKKDRLYQGGDELIELYLQPGDAYEMDGIMQESYSHSVPKETGAGERTTRFRRMCVVFRTGMQKCFEKDTGETCLDLLPRKARSYTFGHIDGLKEGCFYTRRELIRMNAFQLLQRGVSGCGKSGADAIIISGKRCGDDTFDSVRYVVEWRIGANALFQTFLHRLKVRVFRSLNYLCCHNICGTVLCHVRKCTSKLYRYDGLYRIHWVNPPTEPRGTFDFFLNRTGKNVCETLGEKGNRPCGLENFDSKNGFESNRASHGSEQDSLKRGSTSIPRSWYDRLALLEIDCLAVHLLVSLRSKRCCDPGTPKEESSFSQPLPDTQHNRNSKKDELPLPANTRSLDGKRIRVRMYYSRPPKAFKSRIAKRSCRRTGFRKSTRNVAKIERPRTRSMTRSRIGSSL